MLDYASVLESYLIEDAATEGIGSTLMAWARNFMEMIQRLLDKIRAWVIQSKLSKMPELMIQSDCNAWFDKVTAKRVSTEKADFTYLECDADLGTLNNKDERKSGNAFTSIAGTKAQGWITKSQEMLKSLQVSLKRGRFENRVESETNFRSAISVISKFITKLLTILSEAIKRTPGMLKDRNKKLGDGSAEMSKTLSGKSSSNDINKGKQFGSTVLNAIDKRDTHMLRSCLNTTINLDPRFNTAEFDDMLTYIKEHGIDLEVPYEKEPDEFELPQDEWTKNYFYGLTEWLRLNFAPNERLPHIKAVGKAVFS